MMRNVTKRDVQELLAAERAALMKTNYTDLSRVISHKTELLEGMSRTPSEFSHEDLEEVKRGFLLNNDLIESSLRGLRSALETIESTKNALFSLRVYSPTGSFPKDLKKAVEKKC